MSLGSIIYPVSDLDAAKKLFGTLLGVEPHTDTPYYVGYNVNGLEIALNPHGHAQGLKGSVPFWTVPDVAAAVAELTAAGATVTQDTQDVGGGAITAALVDADGNAIGLIQG